MPTETGFMTMPDTDASETRTMDELAEHVREIDLAIANMDNPEALQDLVDMESGDALIESMDERDSTPKQSPAYSHLHLLAARAYRLDDPADLTAEFLRNALAESEAKAKVRWAARGVKRLTPEEFEQRVADAKSIVEGLFKN
jgi:hypothetical protein